MDKSIDIQSNIKNICKAEYFLNNIFKSLKFSRKNYCRMYLSVNEAVSNAIIHGNILDETKIVKINFKEKSDKYLISIIDQGNGFDYKNLNDPTHKDNIYKESGRGIFIMYQYADKVDFQNNGSTVNLTFNK